MNQAQELEKNLIHRTTTKLKRYRIFKLCSKSKAQTADWDWEDTGITYWIRYWICRGFIITNDGIEHSNIQSHNTCFKDLPLKI